jgi:serine/threonine-protein phosphatase 4 regulatory subunit 1
LTSFYTDPARPLICAFNYPAVALTLGRARWGELREAYLEIAENKAVAVRRTLAASLGELAKIVGEDHAERDLMGVWWGAVRAGEEEVRDKALECVQVFVAALGKEPRIAVVDGLLTIWQEGGFRGWRERKCIANALTDLAGLVGQDVPAILRGLLKKALEDGVAAVREAAISAVSCVTDPLYGSLTLRSFLAFGACLRTSQHNLQRFAKASERYRSLDYIGKG